MSDGSPTSGLAGPVSSGPWYYLSQAYQEKILEHCIPDTVAVREGGIVSGVDMAEFVKKGCIRRVLRTEGRWLAETSASALLATGQLDALRSWLDSQEVEEFEGDPGVLRQYLFADRNPELLVQLSPQLELLVRIAVLGQRPNLADPDGSRLSELLKMDSFDPCFVVQTCKKLLGDERAPEQLLADMDLSMPTQTMERCDHLRCYVDATGDIDGVRSLAMAYDPDTSGAGFEFGNKAALAVLVLGDSKTGRECLADWEELCRKPYTSRYEWERCSRAWIELLFNAERGRRCLKEAQGFDWGRGDLACAWMDLFADREAALKSLQADREVAEAKGSVGLFKKTAYGYARVLGDVPTATQCLESAEELSHRPREVADLAAAWKSLVPDSAKPGTLLERAEGMARATGDQIYVAEHYLRILKDPSAARRRLQQMMEDSSRGPASLAEVAQACAELFPDDSLGLDIMARADKKCRATSTWERFQDVVEAWVKPFGRTEEALRLLSDVQAGGVSAESLLRCVKLHLVLFQDRSRAISCMQRAEDLAGASGRTGTLLECAKTWVDLLDDRECARRTIERAEKNVGSTYEFGQVADAWISVLSDREQAARTVLVMKEKARTTSDWLTCAWVVQRVIEDKDETRHCVQKAEDLAKDFNDWKALAETWGAGEYGSRVRGCDDAEHQRRVETALAHCERLAHDSRGWIAIAKMWGRLNVEENAEKAISKARELANSGYEQEETLDAANQLGLQLSAQQTLETMTRKATSTDDWIAVAKQLHTSNETAGDWREALAKAEATAMKSSEWDGLAHVWARFHDTPDDGKHCLDRAEQLAHDAWDWHRLAGTWGRPPFEDQGKARDCLIRGESKTKTADAGMWIRLADTWADLIKDKESATRCLHRAEEAMEVASVRYSYDRSWRKLAQAWIDLLDDQVSARRCLQRAEAQGESRSYRTDNIERAVLGNEESMKRLDSIMQTEKAVEALLQAAGAWARSFNEPTKARLALERAAEHASTTKEWTDVANAWMSLFRDTKMAAKMLGRADRQTDGFQDLCLLARFWNFLGHEGEVARCMARAEKLASGVSEVNDLATEWKRLGRHDDVKRCLALALQQADHTYDFVILAGHWRSWFGDIERAAELLRLGEGRCSSGHDWKWLAKEWLHHDRKKAQECLVRAESSVQYPWERTTLAKLWKKSFGDEEQARRVIVAGLAAAENTSDYTRYAKDCIEILGDRDGARECLRRGDAMASSLYDWTYLAEAWHEIFGDSEATNKCMVRAENIAKESVHDWEQLAGDYKSIGDRGACSRCLQRAEQYASNRKQWTYLGERWEALLGDSDARERCIKRAGQKPWSGLLSRFTRRRR